MEDSDTKLWCKIRFEAVKPGNKKFPSVLSQIFNYLKNCNHIEV